MSSEFCCVYKCQLYVYDFFRPRVVGLLRWLGLWYLRMVRSYVCVDDKVSSLAVWTETSSVRFNVLIWQRQVDKARNSLGRYHSSVCLVRLYSASICTACSFTHNWLFLPIMLTLRGLVLYFAIRFFFFYWTCFCLTKIRVQFILVAALNILVSATAIFQHFNRSCQLNAFWLFIPSVITVLQKYSISQDWLSHLIWYCRLNTLLSEYTSD